MRYRLQKTKKSQLHDTLRRKGLRQQLLTKNVRQLLRRVTRKFHRTINGIKDLLHISHFNNSIRRHNIHQIHSNRLPNRVHSNNIRTGVISGQLRRKFHNNRHQVQLGLINSVHTNTISIKGVIILRQQVAMNNRRLHNHKVLQKYRRYMYTRHYRGRRRHSSTRRGVLVSCARRVRRNSTIIFHVVKFSSRLVNY